MKRIEIEQLRDVIRSMYDVEIDYDDYEEELMKDLERGYISEDEFEMVLRTHYQEIEGGQL